MTTIPLEQYLLQVPYLPEVLFGFFLCCFVAQLGFLLIRQRRLAAYKQPNMVEGQPGRPISVIISARNEAENLQQYLPSILEQQYPDFEVVVVNDCSVDASHDVLMNFSKNYSHLKIVTVTEHRRFKTGKKFALTMGIKAARYEHLLFTDADCQPASASWISAMAGNFTGDIQIVLGYSPYFKARGFINAFTRFETLRTAINYLSAALGRDPYMGVGRNLAYTKSLFFGAKGFASHLHVMAGDDDLFINRTATAANTAIEINPDAFVYTDAKRTFGAYIRQKKRHMGVGRLYRASHRRLLSFDAVTGFLFYVMLGVCLFNCYYTPWVIVAYVVRLIAQIIVYKLSINKLGNKDLLWFFPFFDLFYFLYLNVFGLLGTFIKTKQWK